MKNIKKIIWIIFFLSIFFRILILFSPQDMWHDASFTVLFAQEPIKEILSSNDVHPPLYEIIMKPIVAISTNEHFLRTTTILTWCAFFWILYAFLKKHFSNTITLLTLFFMSISPTLIFYSLELRNYLIGMTFVIAQVYYFFQMIHYYRRKEEWLFILFSLLMLYTHYFTAFTLLVEAIYLIWIHNKNIYRKFIKAYSIISLFTIPLVIYFLMTLPKMHSMWFKDITWWSFISTISYQLFLPDTISQWHIIFLILFVPLVVFSFMDRNNSRFALILFFIPVILVWLISQLTPMYHHRFFLFYAFGLYIIIAKTIEYLLFHHKRIFVIIGACFLIVFVGLFASAFANLFDTLPRELYDCQKFLKEDYLDKNKAYVFVHTSSFSQTPFKFYFKDWKVINLLKTNLTKKERFTAGGSVIKDWEIITDENKIPFNYLTITESSRYTEGKIIYNKGGLIVYENQRNI